MPVPAYSNARRALAGFTLVELVVGITLIAIAATLLASIIFPAMRQSAEPLIQQRAASLAQALMDEILSKRYDELTPEGGVPPCPVCSNTLGADSEARSTFDDVDDYNIYCGAGVAVTDANEVETESYRSFRMSVCVRYDGDYNGIDDNDRSAKRITVTISFVSSLSVSAPVVFTAYRANF